MDQVREFEAIRIYDPAIEPFDPATERGTRIADYAEWRDPKMLALWPGKRPVTFFFRRLTRAERRLVEASAGDFEKHEQAFRYGIRRVVRADGSAWTPERIGHPTYFGMTEEELDVWDPTDIDEIGGVVLTRSRVPFDFAPRYRLRPSSLCVWEAVVASLSAAPSPPAAEPSSNAPAAP
jgi:hypothetical protein